MSKAQEWRLIVQVTRSNTATEADAGSTDEEDDDIDEDDEKAAESPLAPRATRLSILETHVAPPKTALVKGRHRLRKAA